MTSSTSPMDIAADSSDSSEEENESSKSEEEEEDDDNTDAITNLVNMRIARASRKTVHNNLSRRTVHNRQTAIANPIMADAIRRTRLGMKTGEVRGKLKFSVPKILHLPPTDSFDNVNSNEISNSGLKAAATRVALYRRFEDLNSSRKEDDSSYFDAVGNGVEVTVVSPLPPHYERGGWRCHAKINKLVTNSSGDQTAGECLYPNRPQDQQCTKCTTLKPSLRPEFAYLRLISPSIRRQRREYERIIRSCDHELTRCDTAERDAAEQIAAFEKGDVEDEEDLIMDIDLVQEGVWQRVDVRDCDQLLASRKAELKKRLATARAEISIMIQCSYELAVVHVQKIVRRFLVRARLDDIRQAVLDLAMLSAAIKIQRMMRSKLAFLEAERRRRKREHFMAIKLQCLVRRRIAIVARNRFYEIYMTRLRHRCATTIQGLHRRVCAKKKLQQLAYKKLQQLAEQETVRLTTLEFDSAVVIQKHYRRCQANSHVANRKIEMGLHSRLLIYLERYVVDGCMFSFVKSINDDYLRYDRTITNTIEREEKMAKTFVDKVINARDSDYSSAWERYKNESNGNTHSDAVHEKKSKKSSLKDKNGSSDPHRSSARKQYNNTMQIYGRSTSKTKKAQPKSNALPDAPIPAQVTIVDNGRIILDAGQSAEFIPDASLNQAETTKLASLKRIKDRLRGQYLKFDIPHGLDDTVARFLVAVALRYKDDMPEDSTVQQHGNFEPQSKEVTRKAHALIEPLIQHLHGKGIIFVRQLLPADNMARILADQSGITYEFIQLSISMLTVLCQIHGGNYLRRKYLMAKTSQLLDTQKELQRESNAKSSSSNNEHFNIASFLGECGKCGAAESYEDDDDNPGGLWQQSTSAADNEDIDNMLPQTIGSTLTRTKAKGWVHKYTSRVISEQETKNPALGMYRSGQLLDGGGCCG